ncbi:MAG: tripartite tricarboxylate transporter TctB family protein [Beijerinckiaceae bacterium]|nr:tripartite tricarboxylate transporter TctB family protein [Beijerinckiaceae bacterium]
MSENQLTRYLNIRDFIFGLLLLGIAIGGFYVNQGYEAGTASRMGPGYMPKLVFALIACFGIGILISALRSGKDPFDGFAWRELGLILGALTAFGTFLDKLGLGLSLIILIMMSSFADRSQTLKGALALTAVLVCLCWVIFILGLKIGIPFLPPILGFS